MFVEIHNLRYWYFRCCRQEYIVLVDGALACVMRAREQAWHGWYFTEGSTTVKLFLKFQKSEAAREQKSEKSEVAFR